MTARIASILLPPPISDDTDMALKGVQPLWIKTTKLAIKAPKNMPGQTRYPKNQTAVKAIPDGGQTGEALVPSNANWREP